MPAPRAGRTTPVFALGLLAGAVTVTVTAATFGADPAAPGRPDGPRRIPWTSSHFAGTPDPPPPYTIERAFPKLAFRQPVALAVAKGTGRLFVAELKGKIFSFRNAQGTPTADLAIDLARDRPDLSMSYGLTFHPDFPRRPYAYVCYALKDGQPNGTRVSRLEVTRDDPPRLVPGSEAVLLTWLAGGHNGGCLEFGPDGYLYISTGDGAGPSPPDPLDTGQDLSDLLSSILRIDVDHAGAATPYRVPADNPFVGHAGARPEIWAYGFRNPWKFSFDRRTGDLWVGDVGWELWEMIDRVVRGGNYGWSLVEGRQPVHPDGRRGPGPVLPPIAEHPHSEAASITGGYVSRGTRLKELEGVYLYGDFQTGKVWGLRPRPDRGGFDRPVEVANTPLQLVAFGEDEAGEIYALDYERTGAIYRFIPNAGPASNRDFPRLLSRTGLFASVADHRLADGLIPYEINAGAWSDGHHVERFAALPGDSRIKTDPNGAWTLPEGAVLGRTISSETGRVGVRRRIETQVLHLESGTWRPYTYVWNEAQDDARLADPQGETRTIERLEPESPGGRRGESYPIAGRAECLRCHNPWAGNQGGGFGRQSASPLAFNLRQLNRDANRDRRDGQSPANQLRTLETLGVFDGPLPAPVAVLPAQVDPYGPSNDRERKARSYLQVNCAHCHQLNAGGAATLILSEAVALPDTRTLGVPPRQGTFNIDDARIIAPGHPERSVLVYRMAKQGGGRMPRAGSQYVDPKGLALIADWVEHLPESAPPPIAGGSNGALPPSALAALASLRPREPGRPAPGPSHDEAIRSLLQTTRGALALLLAFDRGKVAPDARRAVLAAVRDHPRSEVRDLFERFLPEDRRPGRIGDHPRAEDILRLDGDPTRGEHLFHRDSATTCRNCHRIDGKGAAVGPDLSQVGKALDKAALLREIVEPSRTIHPQFVSYLLETRSGQVHTGLLTARNGREVVLTDPANQVRRFPAAEVEHLVPQTTSLMPDHLLRDLTPQQAADLLAYLAARK